MLEMIMAYARSFTSNIVEREEGQAMVEYALILALVSIAAIAVLLLFGPAIAGLLTTVVNAL
jgi:Flp pilus assembly pilin Flp